MLPEPKTTSVAVYVYTGVLDMRVGFDRLAARIQAEYHRSATSLARMRGLAARRSFTRSLEPVGSIRLILGSGSPMYSLESTSLQMIPQ